MGTIHGLLALPCLTPHTSLAAPSNTSANFPHSSLSPSHSRPSILSLVSLSNSSLTLSSLNFSCITRGTPLSSVTVLRLLVHTLTRIHLGLWSDRPHSFAPHILLTILTRSLFRTLLTITHPPPHNNMRPYP